MNKMVKKTLLLIIVLFIFPNTSFSSINTDNQEYKKVIARELYLLYVLANDWQQTLDISKSEYHTEKNHILGEHPNTNSINTYFASCAAGHILITYLLPENLREYWQLTWIGIESSVIQNNDEQGLDQNIGFSYNFKYSFKF